MVRFEAEYLDGYDLYKEIILSRLPKASKSVWIATANLKDLHVEQDGRYVSLVRVLGELSAEGVDVRILHSGNPSSPFGKSLGKSRSFGSQKVRIRRCPRSHFKAILIDNSVLYLGSANLTGAGLGAKAEERRNFETGILTQNPVVLREVREMFRLIWDGEFCPECGRRANCTAPLDRSED